MRIAPLVLATILAVLAEPWPVVAANYTEVIPAMGPGLLPGPVAIGGGDEPPGVLRAQIVDNNGRVDFAFKEYGQNWMCLGSDGDPDNPDNYPVVAIFDVGPQPQGFDGRELDLGQAAELARIGLPMERDAETCTAADDCYRWHSYLKPLDPAPRVRRGDVLVWVALRRGSNCPGQWWFNHQGIPPYPAAAGGEITLGIHVGD